MADIGAVVKSTLIDGNATFNVAYEFDPASGLNRVIREQETPAAKVGKRYECGENLAGIRGDKPVVTTYSGTHKLGNGVEVFMGCGMMVLYSKLATVDGAKPEVPSCHDRPLVLIATDRVPSAD